VYSNGPLAPDLSLNIYGTMEKHLKCAVSLRGYWRNVQCARDKASEAMSTVLGVQEIKASEAMGAMFSVQSIKVY